MPGPAAAGHLERGGGEPRRAHVLDADDRVGLHQLEARLEEQLLGERVADLHGRALLFRLLVELGGRHRRAVDAVAPRLRADVDHRIADAGRFSLEDHPLARDPESEDVDEDVAVVRRMERGLAADRRDADAVAVAGDPADDAVDEVLHARRVERSEPERVERRDRARAHGEDVAEDPADAGRRPLVGLDERRVVVRLHLECGEPAVADVDHAGVLARPLHDARPGGGELPQVNAARFVRAVLGPHDREDAELEVVRLAPEDLPDPVELVGRKAVRGDEGGGDLRVLHGAIVSVDNAACGGKCRMQNAK